MTDYADSSKQIRIGALISYISLSLDILIGLLYTPWMISQIGKSDYGIYSLAVSFIAIFILDFGLGASVTKFLSKYRSENDQQSIDRFLGMTFKLYLIIDIFLFIILLVSFLFIENIFTELTVFEIEKLKTVFVITGLFTVINFPFTPLNGILTSYERFSFLKTFGLFTRLLQVLVLIIVILLGFGLYGITIVIAAIGIINIIVKLFYLKNNTSIRIDFSFKNKKMFKELFGFSIFITVALIFEQLTLNICPTILGRVSGGTDEITYFSVGRILYTYILTFAGALNGLFLPTVTRMINNDDNMDSLNNLMIKVGRIQLIIIGLLVVGIVTMGKEFIVLWMGNDFLSSYYVSVFLCIPYIIISTQDIAYMTIMAKDKMYIRVLYGGVTTFICLALGTYLARYYGAVGVAFAFFIAAISGYVFLANILYRKIVNIDVLRFFRECHIKLLIPLVLTCAIGFLTQYLIPVENMLLFFIKAGGLAVIYFVLMWLISFNNYEKNLILGLTKRFQKKVI